MSTLDDMAEFKKAPKGYKCGKHGVYMIDKDTGDKTPITTKPILVKAISRDESGDNWGVLVWWLDLDEKEHEVAIPKKLFHGRGTDIQQLLADGGLPIQIGRERDLLNYLASFNVKDRLIAASCTGWLHNAFVLPTQSLREPAGNKIAYQPSGFSNVPKAIHSHGILKDWQAGLAKASEGVRFLVCASLSSPVRYKAGIEAGGFHIYNTTSQGKTTALQAASSVWGNGADPAILGGDGAYIQRWNATGNALEAVAECFNDLPLVIDEIGEGDPREFGKTIYRIISGTGKSRLKDTANLRNNRSWRVTVLSAGELAVSAFIESGGGQVKGGQLVRMIDIDLSLIEALFSSADEANEMKKLCASHYGFAGVELINRIDDLTDGWAGFNHNLIGDANSSIAERVRTRFALVAHTGIIAVKARILPWTESQVISSVKACYSAWHSQIDVVSDVDRGVDNVRNFILSDDARFERENNTPIPQNRAGWFRGETYHFAPKAFKDACMGVDAVKVRKALKELGYLHINKIGKLTSNISVGKTSTSVVSVKAGIISNALKNRGNRGITGTMLDDTRATSNTPSESQGVTEVLQSSSNTPQYPLELQGVTPESYATTDLAPPALLIPLKNSQRKENSDEEEVF